MANPIRCVDPNPDAVRYAGRPTYHWPLAETATRAETGEAGPAGVSAGKLPREIGRTA